MTRYLILTGLFFFMAYEVYGKLPCKDRLTPDLCVKDSKGKKYCNCRKLIQKYRSACQQYGKPGGLCCKTCSKLDPCYDNPWFTYTVRDKKYKCKSLVKTYPILCAQDTVKKHCCKSCKKRKGPKDDCNNNPYFKITITVRLGKKTDVCKNCNCGDIKNKGKDFAAVACINYLVKKNCCKMCHSLK